MSVFDRTREAFASLAGIRRDLTAVRTQLDALAARPIELPAAALVRVQPGDRVVLRLPSRLVDEAAAAQVRAKWREQFGDDTGVLIVGSDWQIIVFESDDEQAHTSA